MVVWHYYFSNFGSLKSTETLVLMLFVVSTLYFSNFGSLKSTETQALDAVSTLAREFQQFRLVEEH